MLRTAVALLLLGVASASVADVIDCGSVPFSLEGNVLPGPLGGNVPATLQFRNNVPFVVTSFGTCHQESVPLPAVAGPTQYTILWIYDLTYDDGTTKSMQPCCGILIPGVNTDPVKLTLIPETPTNTSPSTSRIYADDLHFPSSYEQAATTFTVTAAPKHRATQH